MHMLIDYTNVIECKVHVFASPSHVLQGLQQLAVRIQCVDRAQSHDVGVPRTQGIDQGLVLVHRATFRG
jgi:hypothetical protein